MAAGGDPLSTQTVLDVFDYFKGKFPGWTVEKAIAETAAATGVGTTSVYRFRRERKDTGQVITPRKPKRLKQKVPSEKTYDDFIFVSN